MVLTSIEAYALSKKYTDNSMAGGGSVAGKNCVIDSITPITGGNRVTFKWTLDNGTVQTNYMDVMDGDKGETGDDGLGIKSVDISAQNHLIITYDDDTTHDAGELSGGSGEVISVNGKKGVVTLDANDVGALPDDTELFSGDYDDLSNKPDLFSGDYEDLTNKPDLSGFITKSVNDLTNYYLKSETYTKTEVDNIITAVKNSRFEVVSTLPTTDIKTNVIYLVPKSTAQTSNAKDEYINLDGTSAGWEKIGDTEIDLSGYVTTTALNTALTDYTTTTDLTALLAGKVDKVTGKGLSTNDYTNADKALVDSIPNLAPISLVKDTVGWIGKNLFNVNTVKELPTGVVLNKTDTGIQVHNTVAATWRFASFWIVHLSKNKDYILSCNVLITSGKGKILIKDFETQTSIFDVNVEDGETFTKKFNTGNYNSLYLTMYCATNTEELGDVTYNNLMLRHADITDDTYEPYHESVEVMYEEEIHGINVLKNRTSSTTSKGITATPQTDGSIIYNGTSTSNGSIQFLNPSSWPNCTSLRGAYTFSFESSAIVNGGNCVVGLLFMKSDGTEEWKNLDLNDSTKDSFTVTLTDDFYLEGYGQTYFQSGITVSNLNVKLMLRKAEVEDSTYRPYNHQAIQNQINAQGVLGAKNLLPNNATSKTVKGVTFTVNDDGSVTASGTATDNIPYLINGYLLNILDVNKRYIYSGSPNTASEQTYFTYIGFNPGNGSFNHEYGSGVEFSLKDKDVDYTNVNYYIFIRSGAILNNIVFKPMIRLASDPDDTYQPYAMTNRELTEKVFEKRTLTSDNNLNNITETGIYGITTKPTNAPEDTTTYCTLIVQKTSIGDIRQIVIRSVNAAAYIYTRSYGGSPLAWTPWFKFTGTVVS